MTTSSCNNPLLQTPLSHQSNDLLRRSGVLVRSLDVFDWHRNDLTSFFKHVASRPETTQLQYLPASFLHLKLKVPNAIYADQQAPDNNPGISVLVGSKYKRNLKFFTRNSERFSSDSLRLGPGSTVSKIDETLESVGDSDDNDSVDCILYYPSDAGSMTRGVLEQPPRCMEDRTTPLCINETCLATNASACGPCRVPGEIMGWMLGQQVRHRKGKRLFMPIHYICSYDQEVLESELVEAANSMWLERSSWFRHYKTNNDESAKYFQGWTECTATRSIQSLENMDAIILQVDTPRINAGSSLSSPDLCHHEKTTLLQQRLQLAHDLQLTQHLPVLMYRETNQTLPISDCVELWGGDCRDAWYREFYAQEFMFPNGACLKRPPNCDEVYYFADCKQQQTPNITCRAVSLWSSSKLTASQVSSSPSAFPGFDYQSPVYRAFQRESQKQTQASACPKFLSTPIARQSNHYLYHGAGVLIRSSDVFDLKGPFLEKAWKQLGRRPAATKLQYLAASHLSAKMRAPNAIFQDMQQQVLGLPENLGFSVLVGTRYRHNVLTDQTLEHVDCYKYYPTDAGTISRGELEEPPTCFQNVTLSLCVEGRCLASNNSACGPCRIAGNETGELFTEFIRKKRGGKKIFHPLFYTCYYDSPVESISASNSMWETSDLWFRLGKNPELYQGWTECTASSNIRDVSLLDAVVIPTSTPMWPSENGCHLNITMMQQRLQLARDRGYGSLPVLLYRETMGMTKLRDCIDQWGGVDCDFGWQKEFYALEHKFNDGGCLAKPKSCEEVYYFPDCSKQDNHICEAGELVRMKQLDHVTGELTQAIPLLPEVQPSGKSSQNYLSRDAHSHGGRLNIMHSVVKFRCESILWGVSAASLASFVLWKGLRIQQHRRCWKWIVLVLLGSSTVCQLCGSHRKYTFRPPRESFSGTISNLKHRPLDLPLWQTLQNNFSSRGKLQQPEIQCNTSVCFFATREPSDYVYILLTSDIHGHMKHSCRAHWCYPGAPSIATVAMRLSGEPFLLVDTGDSLFGASDLSETNVVKVMNRLGYHAMGLGNHDWDVGPERLKKFAEQARFPILASNTEGVHFVRKHLQVDLGGVRLCLVGVTTSEPNPFANATIYNEDSVLIYASDLKRQGVCHHVVLMSHAGMPVDKALAQSSHIDLILGGHSHFITGASGNPESVEFGSAILAAPFFYYNDTTVPIVHVGSYGRYVGLIKLDLKSSFKMEGHLLPLDIEHGVFPDEDMEAWIQKEMSSETEDPSITVPLYVEASQNEVCGFICRNRECLLGNLAADAMSHAVKGMFPDHPVIALLESGTLRDCVSHREDFSSVFPWPNHLVVLSVNGSILLDMLEHGLRQPGGGAFLQTSGVRYRYRSKTLLQGSLDPFPAVIQTEAGGSVLAAIQYDSPCALVENATLVQNGSFYHVVVTDWLASGGDGFSMAEAAQKQVLANLTLRKVVLDYITQVSPRIYLDRRSCAIRVATASSNAMAGLIGGYVSFFASYPLYTLFVRRSIKHGSTRKTGLYQGVFLGSMATAFCQFIYFLIYYSESLEHGISSFWRSTIGAVSTVVATNPLWVVVTKVQMMPHGGTVQAIHAVLKESGFSGFFKGIAMNLAMCCFPVVRQIVMEALLKRIGGSDENPAYVALAAGIAACAATFVTLPIQRWRVRLQQGLVDGITMSHLYDGLLFKMAHSAFSSFVLFIVKVSLDDINLAAFLSD